MHKMEQQYIELIKDVLANGKRKDNTLYKFGAMMRCDLAESFPLLTTKKMFFRGIVEELLWFISGSTDSKVLENRGVDIWKANSSREYLDSHGFSDRREGDLGPVYGFQWRHFGATYTNADADYRGQGIDQLQEIINAINTKPSSRRLVMSSWNPVDIPKMALPPCHVMCQFSVHEGRLSCMLTQRSCDIGLGVPFNIASYSLLTYMIAHLCGLTPGEFVYSLGDVHIYESHIPALQEQIKREILPAPRLKIVGAHTSIDDFKYEHFYLQNYEHHPSIVMQIYT